MSPLGWGDGWKVALKQVFVMFYLAGVFSSPICSPSYTLEVLSLSLTGELGDLL